MSTTSSVIPEGHTFLNPTTFVSQKAYDMIMELLKKADDRDPDLHNLYIYNDFFNYAILDLVDSKLSTIHTRIIKKDWDQAFHVLEALTVFQEYCCSSWPMIDDGERTVVTNKAYGACLVTVLRKLIKEGRLDETNFPSLETLLKGATSWGESMKGISAGSDYFLVCKGIGKRLFAGKEDERKALMDERVEEWINTMDEEEQAELREAMEEEDEDDDEDEDGKKPWYAGEADENDDDADYRLTRVWKEYKDYLREVPTVPLRGPPYWDISDWTAQEKAEFSFDRF